MAQNKIHLLINYLLLCITIAITFTQNVNPEITSERKRIIIIANQSEYAEIGKDIAQITSSVATKLKRYEVIDRNQLDIILDEQKIDIRKNHQH